MHLSKYLPNAKPWIEKALNNNWQALSEIVPAEMMPSQERLLKTGRRTFAKEYGCGAYGCVLPTQKKDVVFKMTTDATEASFVASMLAMRGLPEGVVRYHAVVELPEKKGRDRIFALWREEARDIGFLTKGAESLVADGISDAELRASLRSFKNGLANFKESAEKVLEYYVQASMSRASVKALESRMPPTQELMASDPDALKGVQKALFYVGLCDYLARDMSQGFLGNTVGDALHFFIERGYVLADVHFNNVGIVDRSDGAAIVITDPGHAVPLKEALVKFPVPHLLDRDIATTRRLRTAAN